MTWRPIELRLALKQWNVQQLGFDENKWVAAAQILICLDLIAMTRAFALVSLIELVLWVTFLSVPVLRQRFVQTLKDSRVVILVGFLLAIGISMLWAEQAPWSERFEEWWSWRKLILFPMVLAVFQTLPSKRLVLMSVIFISAVFMMLSWAGYFGLVVLDRPYDYLLENDVTQGIMFAASAFFLWMLLREGGSPPWAHGIGWLLIIGFISNILLLLTGRSGYVFLMVVIGMAFWISFDRWRWVAVVIGLGLVASVLLTSQTARTAILQGVHEVQSVHERDAEFSSMGIRIIMWTNTWDIIQAHPILGTGSGDYQYVYGDLVSNIEGWRGTWVEDPHQQYLHIWAEQGLVALCLFLGFLCVCFFSLSQHWTHRIALTLLIATALNSFVSGHFSSFVEGRLFWIVFAAMIAGDGFRVPAWWAQRHA